MISEFPFDKPIFKLLANNDTGAARGHQGGFVIPKDLDKFFPDLRAKVSAATPTPSQEIFVIMYLDGEYVEAVKSRYQYQTWGGTRSPERRMTGGLGPILNGASGGDYIVIERSLERPNLYRLAVWRKNTAHHKKIMADTAGKKCGPLYILDRPVSRDDFEIAEERERASEAAPLILFDNDAVLTETRTMKFARSSAFRMRVCTIYEETCSVCGSSYRHPDGRSEVEAAHIVPRHRRGADDARNGIALCRSHHWAFDQGLFSIDKNMEVVVADRAKAEPKNAHLTILEGRRIANPTEVAMKPSEKAVRWHRKNVFLK